MEQYETCLSDIEPVLPELAAMMGAEYTPGAYSKAEARFIESGNEAQEWHLVGRSGLRITVLFEKHEGYFFITASGTGDRFHQVAVFLYEKYLEQGGNPDAQQKPAGMQKGTMRHVPLSVFQVETPDGLQWVVALQTMEQASTQGLLPQAVVGELSHPPSPDRPVVPESLTPNRTFLDFLHETIAQGAPRLDEFQAQARDQGTGWLHVVDPRTPDPEGGVPPEDILGAFEVMDGRLVDGSYVPNGKYRILTARGFFRLGEALETCLLEALKTRRNQRKQGDPHETGRGGREQG